VTIKSLLFCLFLYVCLAWVGVAYFRPEDFVRTGLFWTGIGLMAVLTLVIGSRLFAGFRLWRAKAAARPAAPPKPVAPVHPDDAAMSALIAEASSALAKSPSYSGVPLSSLPLYLLVGPEASGKTSTFLNSGMEPQLLAGDGTALASPTRLCNLWLAKGAIFAELGGRAFAGEAIRWNALLGALRGQRETTLWRRLWREAEPQMNLRGVIAFCDSKELTGASSDPQRLERSSREWQERLRAIAEKFSAEFPVYTVFTKCDKIPYFSDFFRRLHDSDAGQVFGCTLPRREERESGRGEIFAEAEAKRLTASFRPLYQALAKRRITHLAHEPNPGQRPGVYEFPRELKRIRSPLVQFLTDMFRPNPLGPAPLLRGYYLTGVRETQGEVQVAAGLADTESKSSLEATNLFRGDATQLFQSEGLTKGSSPGGRKSISWMFVSDLFHRVILPDQMSRTVLLPDVKVSQYRKAAFAGICVFCGLMSLAFLVSWVNNRNLLSDLESAAKRQNRVQAKAVLQDLQALEALRVQVANLHEGFSLGYHWGLYTGDAMEEQARTLYFQQFQRLLLNDLNGQMVGELRGLPAQPDANARFEPAYPTLKTHLMITGHKCGVEPNFAATQLKQVRAQVAPGMSVEAQKLADIQIEFYAQELARSVPIRLAEDQEGVERGRQYLRKVNGIDKIYASILAEADKTVPKVDRLQDLAPNYQQVLSGPGEVRSAFSLAGWAYVEKASKEAKFVAQGDPCVLDAASGLIGQYDQSSRTAQQIQRLFLRDYVEQWRQFVGGFSIVRYQGAADAAKKLGILSDRKSPLLAMLYLAANQTYFPPPAAPKDPNVVTKVGGLLKKADTAAERVLGTTPADTKNVLNIAADMAPYFQPVHTVVPPGNAKWVVDKNSPYIEALAQLQKSMQDIALKSTDPGAHQTAAQAYDKAIDAARQLTRTFSATGVEGLDLSVSQLLESPIKFAERFIERDPGGAGPTAKKINAELQAFCKASAKVFAKYPIRPGANEEATLDEFNALFQPASGAISTFQKQSLTDIVTKEGSFWKAKDPAKKPLVTPGLLKFLNNAQSVMDSFYPGGAVTPRLTYTFRPHLDPRLKEFTLELEIDGQPFQLTAIQKDFAWPPPAGTKSPGAVARLRTASNAGVPIASRGGLWGIFRIIGDAAPRELNAKMVVWKDTVGVGRREPIEPAPVELEIVGLPGRPDVFNAKFWDGLACPAVAVSDK
jgi:type VI secretion system protein ImpL